MDRVAVSVPHPGPGHMGQIVAVFPHACAQPAGDCRAVHRNVPRSRNVLPIDQWTTCPV
jgi:hypothetical protein